VYRDWPNRESFAPTLDTVELEALLPTLTAGMIPKLTACLEAVRGGVGKAAIIDGRVSHCLVREPFGVSGTVVTR
jgi:acetylglutamate kinase